MVTTEIIACADGGPAPPEGMPETSWYVGIYDDTGTIIGQFYSDEGTARVNHDLLYTLTEEAAQYRDLADS